MFVHTKWLCVKMKHIASYIAHTYITKFSIVYNNLCTAFYLPLITTTHAKALIQISVSMQLFFFFESCKEHLKNRFTQLPFTVVCHTSFLCNWNNQQSRMYENFKKYEWVRKLTSYSVSCTTLQIWMNFKFVKSDVNTTVSTLFLKYKIFLYEGKIHLYIESKPLDCTNLNFFPPY